MIFLAFLLDGIFSLYFSNVSFLFTISTIAFISYKDDTNLLSIMVAGILYDIVYTNTIIVNTLIFYILFLISLAYNKKYRRNLFNLVLLNNIVTILYILFTYLLLRFYGVINYNIFYMLISILKCLILNSFYIIILYILFHKNKFYT